jgi:hypothetical protein
MESRKRESPTGAVETKVRRKPDTLDEEEIVPSDADPLADYDDFADPGDSNPDDRRRDPLRR